jgi:hypothetical protein
MTEGNQGPSHLAPHPFDANHSGADGLLIGDAIGVVASILPYRVSFQFFHGSDAERGCGQWALIQDP